VNNVHRGVIVGQFQTYIGSIRGTYSCVWTTALPTF